MKTATASFGILLLAALGLMSTGRVTAQTFTTLHSFAAVSTNGAEIFTNSDGANPVAILVLSGNTLYGTTPYGGTNGNGTVFAIATNGANFTVLHRFTTSFTNGAGIYTNGDGTRPQGGLTLSGNTLYGTAEGGGTNGEGTVFALNPLSLAFTNLHNFTALNPFNGDGADPVAGLISSANTLYGTTYEGGSSGYGAVFAFNTVSLAVTNLHSFAPNSDGSHPDAGLILSGNTLYGTAQYGGTNSVGTVFAVETNGSNFTVLHSFTALNDFTNNDGAYPTGGLILAGNTLYGTTYEGGTNGSGTLFAVNTNGSNFTALYTFTAISNSAPFGNNDGADPSTALILSGGTLYGAAGYGGLNGNGTLFAVSTNGSNFTTLHSFSTTSTNGAGTSTNSDGVDPSAGLILSGITLYGTTYSGGTNGEGTIFSLLILPQLTITPAGANVVLSWPTNTVGRFTLESVTNLASTNWSTNLPSPVVVNGRNTVTTAISGTQKFYRLSQ